SNADMMLITVFKDEESLKGYQKSPLHNAAADKYVRPYTAQRLCFDFEE
ncbi:MAG TPA: stress responsive protein, partial [Ruminococcaceae bacterium]|nr:stress responsive protein [Oscillospiraceae bacterium]